MIMLHDPRSTIHDPRRTERFTRRLIWSLIALIATIDAIALFVMGISIQADIDVLYHGGFVTFCLLASIIIRNKWNHALSANGFEAFAQFMAFVFSFVMLNYIASATTRPFYDETFYNMDLAIGFNWRDYVGWLNEHPIINQVFSLAYQSLKFQMFSVISALAITHQYQRLSGMMLAIMLSALSCIVLAALFPAVAPYTYLKIQPTDFPNVSQAAAYIHVSDLMAMREGSFKLFVISHLKGIVAFPSFHASLAVLLAWGFWTVPYLRWPFLLLNLTMLACIAPTGGHYMVDVIGGVVIALVMLAVMKRITGYDFSRTAGITQPINSHQETV